MAPPLGAELFEKVHFSIRVSDPSMYIAPPRPEAWFEVKVQFLIMGEKYPSEVPVQSTGVASL